jgi:hypothetical protein
MKTFLREKEEENEATTCPPEGEERKEEEGGTVVEGIAEEEEEGEGNHVGFSGMDRTMSGSGTDAEHNGRRDEWEDADSSVCTEGKSIHHTSPERW